MPSFIETSALPPDPNTIPTAPRTIMNGITRFTAANGTAPTKLEMKKPSTIP